MKIALIGTGHVGAALARGWARQGHELWLGARGEPKPETLALAQELGPRAQVVPLAAAAAAADLLVLATPWAAVPEAVRALGPLAGKVLVDCTNPLRPDLSGLTTGADHSGAEIVAGLAPGAAVVKCFNSTGANIMADPQVGGQRALMLLCGDDPAAKAQVRRLSEELGFETVDAGGLAVARLLEPFALLWIHLAYRAGLGRDFAFRLVRR